MAFDTVATANPARGRKAAGDMGMEDVGSVLAALPQRVYALTQMLATMNKLISTLGSPADTVSFRSRLQTAETKLNSAKNDIDATLRRVRVEIAEHPNPLNAKSLEKLSDQFAEIRKLVADTIKMSQAKQRQFTPNPDAPADTKVFINKMREEGVELSSIQLRQMRDVDEAIAEERRLEAALIAQEAIAVDGVARDIGGLVHQQGETIDKVEQFVDETKDSVIKGNEDLKIAAKYQSGYRKKCLFFALLILVLIAVVVVPVLLHVVPGL